MLADIRRLALTVRERIRAAVARRRAFRTAETFIINQLGDMSRIRPEDVIRLLPGMERDMATRVADQLIRRVARRKGYLALYPSGTGSYLICK